MTTSTTDRWNRSASRMSDYEKSSPFLEQRRHLRLATSVPRRVGRHVAASYPDSQSPSSPPPKRLFRSGRHGAASNGNVRRDCFSQPEDRNTVVGKEKRSDMHQTTRDDKRNKSLMMQELDPTASPAELAIAETEERRKTIAKRVLKIITFVVVVVCVLAGVCLAFFLHRLAKKAIASKRREIRARQRASMQSFLTKSQTEMVEEEAREAKQNNNKPLQQTLSNNNRPAPTTLPPSRSIPSTVVHFASPPRPTSATKTTQSKIPPAWSSSSAPVVPNPVPREQQPSPPKASSINTPVAPAGQPAAIEAVEEHTPAPSNDDATPEILLHVLSPTWQAEEETTGGGRTLSRPSHEMESLMRDVLQRQTGTLFPGMMMEVVVGDIVFAPRHGQGEREEPEGHRDGDRQQTDDRGRHGRRQSTKCMQELSSSDDDDPRIIELPDNDQQPPLSRDSASEQVMAPSDAEDFLSQTTLSPPLTTVDTEVTDSGLLATPDIQELTRSFINDNEDATVSSSLSEMPSSSATQVTNAEVAAFEEFASTMLDALTAGGRL